MTLAEMILAAPGLVGYWKLDDPEDATVAADSFVNGNDLERE